jgi:hypothetical protein
MIAKPMLEMGQQNGKMGVCITLGTYPLWYLELGSSPTKGWVAGEHRKSKANIGRECITDNTVGVT